MGTPYASEAIDPLNEINGNGGIGVLEHYGFVGPHLENEPMTKWRFRTRRRAKHDGPLKRMIDEFSAANAIPENERPGLSLIGGIVPDPKREK